MLAHALKRSSRLRRSFVAKHALALLQLLGIQHAEVRTDPTGTGVTVLVPAADACGHSRTAEAQIQSGIRKAFSFVRRVGVLVGSQDFAAYTTAHCKAVALPDVAGKLVYSASGHTGDTTTPAFQIARSHWTVVYENDSSYMAMFVLEDDQYTKQVFSTQSSGTGKLTFTGTGSFKLRISDAGDWQIKVYD